MQIPSTAEPGKLRRPGAFAISAGLHGLAVAWIAFAPPFPGSTPSLYDREIRPRQDHLIWYKLADKLPDIRPTPEKGDSQPPRARKKFDQTIVAGKRDNSHPPQLIFAPAPEIETPKLQPLPNLVSVTRPPARPFSAPTPPPPPPVTNPKLPDAPQVPQVKPVKDLVITTTAARPAGLPFKPPAPRRIEPQPQLTLPPAPEIDTPAASLPDAISGVAAQPNRLTKRFTPPAATQRAAQAGEPGALPTAPTLPTSAEARPDAPELVIAGLAPVSAPAPPAPPASRSAAFSAGPKPRNSGGAGSGEGMLEVPGLLVEGGSKETKPVLVARTNPSSPANLAGAAAAARSMGVPPASSSRSAVRVTAAPDPRLDGRVVYTMAIQMPNITSYSGSWLVWFAEHQPEPGKPAQDVQPPVAIRKVDPKYSNAAIEERVEGKVRLWAVIGKDGHLSSVTLLSHLDDRLDRSAEEALSKWLFQPALLDGVPVELDAVFEVPFRLAPKPAR